MDKYKHFKDNPKFDVDSLGFEVVDGDTIVRVSKTFIGPGFRAKVPYEYKDEAFLTKYEKVVFNRTDQAYDTTATIKYWRKPLRIYIDPELDSLNKANFIDFALSIDHRIDSLKVQFTQKPADANYFIYLQGISHEPYYAEPKLERSSNGFYIYWNGASQFTKCYVKINPAFIEKARQQVYLKKHFIRSLGYFFIHRDFDCSSYFSPCFDPIAKISESDIEIIQYHYSFGICKGTRLEDFEQSHKVAKELLLKNPNNPMRFVHYFDE
ncbi:hypothetical protein GCM10011339_40480 [Echinicola rosea]|uniref:Uncharacterized protein n=2 Tax=Echinicola rosea TaxID=1807691 RepID=A0ABQ1VAJ5_9BACT|nr:hypothetical protein GCM10011339_40480 [Echinicola rosea]